MLVAEPRTLTQARPSAFTDKRSGMEPTARGCGLIPAWDGPLSDWGSIAGSQHAHSDAVIAWVGFGSPPGSQTDEFEQICVNAFGAVWARSCKRLRRGLCHLLAHTHSSASVMQSCVRARPGGPNPSIQMVHNEPNSALKALSALLAPVLTQLQYWRQPRRLLSNPAQDGNTSLTQWLSQALPCC